jgi:hypothetical protein
LCIASALENRARDWAIEKVADPVQQPRSLWTSDASVVRFEVCVRADSAIVQWELRKAWWNEPGHTVEIETEFGQFLQARHRRWDGPCKVVAIPIEFLELWLVAQNVRKFATQTCTFRWKVWKVREKTGIEREGGGTDVRLTTEVAVELGEISECGEPHWNHPTYRVSAKFRLLQVDESLHAWRKVGHIVQVNV